jgi:tetratricopeptide (TPR) repeat protein
LQRSLTISTAALIAGCIFAAAVYGCAGSQAAHEISVGRIALLTGNSAQALQHFEQAAALDANNHSTPLQESAWTYVARAHYEAKQYSQARQALDRALVVNPDDAMAQLYLGLVSAQTAINENGRKQIHAGLQAVNERVDYIKRFTPVGEFWDPAGRLSAGLQASIKSVAAAQSDWASALPQIERLGLELENEIDAAQRDESYQRRGGSGGSGDM